MSPHSTLRRPVRDVLFSAIVRALVVSLMVFAPAGCAETPAVAHPAVHYADEAHHHYDEAMALYDESQWVEANDAFRAVRRDYGLSHWGWLADLRIADIDFKQEKYTEALSGYRSWVRYHPTQPEAVYAHFMIARCYYAQIPDDWFLVPATWERDQSTVHDAVTALQRFVTDHPHAEQITEARRLLHNARESLARHEVYVARFYVSRQRYPAAISRLLGVLENFDDSTAGPSALMQLGEIYLRTNRRDEARGAFTQVVDVYPTSEEVFAARRYLAFVGQGPIVPVGANTVPEPPPPEPPPPQEHTGSGSGGSS